MLLLSGDFVESDNPPNSTIPDHPTRSLDLPDSTTLMDGQWIESLQTRPVPIPSRNDGVVAKMYVGVYSLCLVIFELL